MHSSYCQLQFLYGKLYAYMIKSEDEELMQIANSVDYGQIA